MFAQSKHQLACGLSGPRGFKSPSRRHFITVQRQYKLVIPKIISILDKKTKGNQEKVNVISKKEMRKKGKTGSTLPHRRLENALWLP
jgi:hypothetical protein